MAKINRHTGNLIPFAKIAATGERNVFGGLTPSDTLDDNLTNAYEEGWADVTDPSLYPKLRDFNAAMFTAGQLIAYIIQRGMPEYHAQQEYFIGSMCSFDGVIHVSLTDANTGNLLTDPLHWHNLIAADSIGTPELKDNAVTLAKLAHGTPKKLFGFDDLGVPVEVDKTWFGEEQSLVNKILIRLSLTTYTNDTTRPILVLIDSNSNTPRDLFINGQLVAIMTDGVGDSNNLISLMIPPGMTYRFDGAFLRWHEITSDLTTTP